MDHNAITKAWRLALAASDSPSARTISSAATRVDVPGAARIVNTREASSRNARSRIIQTNRVNGAWPLFHRHGTARPHMHQD
jgi:hypothetical protein